MQEGERTEDGTSGSRDFNQLARLRSFIREHRVCWEILPEEIPVQDDRPLQIGFDLALFGAHAHAAEPPRPGCEQCRTILAHLREIAEWILPKAKRLSRYDISVRDNVILYDPVRRNRSEVAVTITILHRAQLDTPVDACEVFCLHEMEGKLKEIGARYRQWEGT